MNTRLQEKRNIKSLQKLENSIVVFNDDVNTFDHVINTFIKILGHSPEQAEQCALLVHNKGKCKVKDGYYEELAPLCTAILKRGISAEVK